LNYEGFLITPIEIRAVSGIPVAFPVSEAVNRLDFVVWTLFTEKGIGPTNLTYKKKTKRIPKVVNNAVFNSLMKLFRHI